MKIEEAIHQTRFRNEQHKAVVNLLFTGSWLENKIKRFFKTYNITTQQYNILRILRGQYPKSASINLIKERMLDQMSDVSRIVERLRSNGYVNRELCPNDRRSVDVTITEKGIALLEELDQYNERMDSLLQKLNHSEIAQLNTLLDKMREMDEEIAPERLKKK